jgi:hypothetical protein
MCVGKSFSPPAVLCFLCCNRIGRCTNINSTSHPQHMLQEHFRIRQAMKTHTLNITHPSLRKNTRILDILGCITTDNTQSLQQQLITLKQHTSVDNVHFTNTGYTKLAEGVLVEAATMVKEGKAKTTPSGGGMLVPYWRRFVIHQGIGAIGGQMWQPESGRGGCGGPLKGGPRGRGTGQGRGARSFPY